jgi:hypothetical protein
LSQGSVSRSHIEMQHKRLRFYIGFHEIAGYGGGLAKAICAAGSFARFVELGQNRFYPIISLKPWERIFRASFSWQACIKRKSGVHLIRLARRLCRFLVIADIFFNYNCVVFLGHQEPFKPPLRRVLKRMGKTIITVFLGSDSRPEYLNGYFLDHYSDNLQELGSLVRKQASDVRTAEAESDYIICHPPCAHFLNRNYVRFLDIGFPFDPKRGEGKDPPKKHDDTNRIRVVHAPSSPKYKGSEQFRSIVARLQAEGFPIEYIEITNKPNAEVLATLSGCDFVVDELYSDTPMAGLAMEAAYFGKPSLVGSYVTPEVLSDCLSGDTPPSFFVHPADIYTTLKKMCESRSVCEDMGRRAKKFVSLNWGLKEVGKRMIELASGSLPESMFGLPGGSRYFHGWGIDEGTLKQELREYIKINGSEGLCLNSEKEKAAILEFLSNG